MKAPASQETHVLERDLRGESVSFHFFCCVDPPIMSVPSQGTKVKHIGEKVAMAFPGVDPARTLTLDTSMDTSMQNYEEPVPFCAFQVHCQLGAIQSHLGTSDEELPPSDGLCPCKIVLIDSYGRSQPTVVSTIRRRVDLGCIRWQLSMSHRES